MFIYYMIIISYIILYAEAELARSAAREADLGKEVEALHFGNLFMRVYTE